MPIERIDSTNSTWLFDADAMRFCRLPRGIDPSSFTVETEWQPYFGLETDDQGAFTVALNEDRTRLLRAWRADMDPDVTAELRLQAELSAD